MSCTQTSGFTYFGDGVHEANEGRVWNPTPVTRRTAGSKSTHSGKCLLDIIEHDIQNFKQAAHNNKSGLLHVKVDPDTYNRGGGSERVVSVSAFRRADCRNSLALYSPLRHDLSLAPRYAFETSHSS